MEGTEEKRATPKGRRDWREGEFGEVEKQVKGRKRRRVQKGENEGAFFRQRHCR